MKINRNSFNFVVGSIKPTIILAVLLFCSLISFAQSKSNDGYYKVISFGTKIDFGTIENGVSWTITSNALKSGTVFLNDQSINDFVFEKAGDYEILYKDNVIHNSTECNHTHFAEKMIVQVSPVKMIFDFSKIVFSDKIRKGKSCDDIYITIPVNVNIKGDASAIFKVANAVAAGIGSEIIAKPVISEITLKNGVQLIQYRLSGIAQKEAYLMFDFIDFNNNVQTYNLPEIIN